MSGEQFKNLVESAGANGFELVDNERLVSIMRGSLGESGGYCPCVPKYVYEESGNKDDYKCICKNAKTIGVCKCGLFTKHGKR